MHPNHRLISDRRVVSPDDPWLDQRTKNLIADLRRLLARRGNPQCPRCKGYLRHPLYELIRDYDSGTTSVRQLCHGCAKMPVSRWHDDEGEVLYAVMISLALPRPQADRLMAQIEGRRGVVCRNLGRLRDKEELHEKY